MKHKELGLWLHLSMITRLFDMTAKHNFQFLILRASEYQNVRVRYLKESNILVSGNWITTVLGKHMAGRVWWKYAFYTNIFDRFHTFSAKTIKNMFDKFLWIVTSWIKIFKTLVSGIIFLKNLHSKYFSYSVSL